MKEKKQSNRKENPILHNNSRSNILTSSNFLNNLLFSQSSCSRNHLVLTIISFSLSSRHYYHVKSQHRHEFSPSLRFHNHRIIRSTQIKILIMTPRNSLPFEEYLSFFPRQSLDNHPTLSNHTQRVLDTYRSLIYFRTPPSQIDPAPALFYLSSILPDTAPSYESTAFPRSPPTLQIAPVCPDDRSTKQMCRFTKRCEEVFIYTVCLLKTKSL